MPGLTEAQMKAARKKRKKRLLDLKRHIKHEMSERRKDIKREQAWMKRARAELKDVDRALRELR